MTRARTFAIVLAGTAASVGLAKHVAYAALDPGLAQVGHALQAIAPDTPGSRDLLTINGARFAIRTESSERDTAGEVDRFLQDCEAHPQGGRGLGVSWATAEGTLAVCLAPPLSDSPGVALRERFERMVSSGDLSRLGELRMLRAMPTAKGSALVYLHSQGSVSLADVLPQRGDAAGEDLPGLPPPGGGHRLLSAISENRQQGVAVYEVVGTEIETRSAYRALLERAGLRVASATPHLHLTSAHGDAYAVGFSGSEGRTRVAIVAVDLLRPAP